MTALAVVTLLAALLGIVARLLRQPVITAYLVAGIIIGAVDFFSLENEALQLFSDLGVTFLLFLIGLEINYDALRIVGRSAALLGVAQIVVTFIGGLAITLAFGFTLLPASYIAIALTFSSTVIVVKLLSEKKDLNSLYGKLSLGFLLAQDIAAIILLVILDGAAAERSALLGGAPTVAIAGVALFAVIIWLGRSVFPVLFRTIARSQELLFIASLGWLFLAVTLTTRLGLSIEIGGFLAGLALANSSEHFQIAGRIKPLRDFFIVIFFALLGSSIALANLHGLVILIIALSLFVLIGNPLIVMTIMGIMGHRKRTGFLTGVALAQISEFSLVLAVVGFRLGHIPQEVVGLVTAVGVITIMASSYMIINAEKLFAWLSPHLALFERRFLRERLETPASLKSFILVGAHRTGQSIARVLPKRDLLVIDFNPDIVAHLRQHGYSVIYGDISDPDIVQEAGIARAKLVVSTSPDPSDNEALLEALSSSPKRPVTIVRAEDDAVARRLYAKGADYVLLPHLLSGHELGHILALDHNQELFSTMRERDVALFSNDPFGPEAEHAS